MLVASHSPHPLCCLKFGAILLALSLFFIVMMPSPFVEASVYAMPQISILDNAVDKPSSDTPFGARTLNRNFSQVGLTVHDKTDREAELIEV